MRKSDVASPVSLHSHSKRDLLSDVQTIQQVVTKLVVQVIAAARDASLGAYILEIKDYMQANLLM